MVGVQRARIDYNRIVFSVDGKVIESRALPQPFKGLTKAPLIIGSVGKHTVSDAVPHSPFAGEIRSIKINRELSDKMDTPSNQPVRLFRAPVKTTVVDEATSPN